MDNHLTYREVQPTHGPGDLLAGIASTPWAFCLLLLLWIIITGS